MNEEVANQALQRIIEKLEPLVEKGVTLRQCGRDLAQMILDEIQSALTSRTEQCAKTVEAFSASDKWVIWNNPQCGYDCHHGRSMDLLASEIRALNQPEKANAKT